MEQYHISGNEAAACLESCRHFRHSLLSHWTHIMSFSGICLFTPAKSALELLLGSSSVGDWQGEIEGEARFLNRGDGGGRPAADM